MIFLRHLLLWTALLVGALPCAADDDGARRLPVPEDLRLRGSEHWYGIYLGGRKVGWALRQMGPLTRAGERFLRSRQVTFMRTESRGKITTTRSERRRIYDARPPYALQRASADTRRGDFRMRVDVQREGPALWALLHEADQNERRVRVTGLLPTFADETTPVAWIRSRPRRGATLTYRQLDLDRLRVEPATLTVTDGPLQGAAVTSTDLRSAAGDTDRVTYDAGGAMLRTAMMGLLEVRREPQAQAQALGKAVDALRLGEARVDKPLGPPELVRELVLRVRGPGAAQIAGGPGQTVERETGGGTAVLRIGPRQAPPVRASAEAQQRALLETRQYPVHHRVVQSLARETVAAAGTGRARARALVDFVDEFVVDSHTVSPLSALDVLAHQRGDCNEHALLLVTLARAAGIPAREVYGLIYKNDDKRTFGRHAWCDLVIDGVWVPVDPFWGEMQISAAHIRLGARDEGPDLRLALAGAEFELVSLRRDAPPRYGDAGN